MYSRDTVVARFDSCTVTVIARYWKQSWSCPSSVLSGNLLDTTSEVARMEAGHSYCTMGQPGTASCNNRVPTVSYKTV